VHHTVQYASVVTILSVSEFPTTRTPSPFRRYISKRKEHQWKFPPELRFLGALWPRSIRTWGSRRSRFLRYYLFLFLFSFQTVPSISINHINCTIPTNPLSFMACIRSPFFETGQAPSATSSVTIIFLRPYLFGPMSTVSIQVLWSRT
jgi:hypothetical protein